MNTVLQNWRQRVIVHDMQTLETLRPLLNDLEAPFRSSAVHWLQNGSRASLIRCEIDGKPLVIKHYKLKNLDKRIRRAVTPSRAYLSGPG